MDTQDIEIKLSQERLINEIRSYYNRVEKFYKIVEDTLKLSEASFTEQRLKAVESRLDKLTENAKQRPSISSFIFEIALTLFNVYTGHLFEFGITKILKDSIAGRRALIERQARTYIELRKKGLVATAKQTNPKFLQQPEEFVRRTKSDVELYKRNGDYWDSRARVLSEEAQRLRSKELSPTSPMMSKLLPSFNDSIQALTAKFDGVLGSSDPAAGSSKTIIQTRLKSSPVAQVSFLIQDAIAQQLAAESACLKFEEIFARSNNDMEFLAQEKDRFTRMCAELEGFIFDEHKRNKFKLVLSEFIEALLWICYLGSPSEWQAVKNESGYFRQIKTFGISSYTPGYFYTISRIKGEFYRHLLDRFHPYYLSKSFARDHELAKSYEERHRVSTVWNGISHLSYSQAYAQIKMGKVVGDGIYMLFDDQGRRIGVDVVQGYRGIPTQPKYSEEDVRTPDRTSDETAFANLMLDFGAIAAQMTELDSYFALMLNGTSRNP